MFTSQAKLGAGTAPQIYRVSYPNGDVERMTNDLEGYSTITLSADGSSIAAIRRSTVNNLWVAPVETGKETEPLTFASGSAGSIRSLLPLPGGAVAFTAPRENRIFLWRMNAGGSDRRQITSQGLNVFGADYARGAGIVFNQIEGEESVLGHVWRMDPDGSGLRQLTSGNGEQLAALSPAGNAILFTKWDEPRSLWAMRLEGGEPYKLVDNEYASESFFSPDGTRVLFSKLEEIDGRLFPRRYIVPLEGGEPTASFLLPPGAQDIAWAPDGKALTYVDENHGWNLMRKLLPEGEPEPLTRFQEGQVTDYDWHPDGSRLVLHRRVSQKDSLWMLKSGEAEPTLITEFKTGATPLHLWAPDEPLLYFSYGTASRDVVLITDFR